MYHNLLEDILHRLSSHRGLVFGSMIITTLLAFEIFNYTTTDYAFSDLLGNPMFLGIPWATILAIAFCGIDFAGITRLFTPERGQEGASETWYLFGAWLLAATMNAILTWWGVSLAVLQNETLGNAIVDQTTLVRIIPIFIAVMVWLIRVLILGTFALAGDRLFSQPESMKPALRESGQKEIFTSPVPVSNQYHRVSQAHSFQGYQGKPKPTSRLKNEPTYHPQLEHVSSASANSRQKELL
jgi:hypothetical protein